MSTLESWFTRAIPHPNPSEFTPTEDEFVLHFSVSRMGGDDLILALFHPNIAITSSGSVLTLPPPDFSSLVDLSKKVDHPGPGTWKQWRIKSIRSCRPIYTLVTRDPNDHGKVKTVGVYAYSKDFKILENPVDDLESLPEYVSDFFDAAMEATKKRGDVEEAKNTELLERVKQISFALEDKSIL
ncbi:hypothetical protein JAAARDRAFT_31883, partial [Jaapia argillacea MUCL 33604]